MYFFRKAHELYKTPAPKSLSPAFWESEDVDSSEWRGFEAVLTGIEHELGNALFIRLLVTPSLTHSEILGRLLYTTGDTVGAVRFFLELLRWSMSTRTLPQPTSGPNGVPSPELRRTDKIYLEDFKVAFKVRLLVMDTTTPLISHCLYAAMFALLDVAFQDD